VNDTTLTHASGCSRPRPTSKPVSPGWLRLRCPECAHVGSLAYVAPVANPTVEREPRPIRATGYRCRDHHDQPVTWRGKGCSRCAADLKRRKAPTARDDYEEAYR